MQRNENWDIQFLDDFYKRWYCTDCFLENERAIQNRMLTIPTEQISSVKTKLQENIEQKNSYDCHGSVFLGDGKVTWQCIIRRVQGKKYKFANGEQFYSAQYPSFHPSSLYAQYGCLFMEGNNEILIYQSDFYEEWGIDRENLTANRQITWGIFYSREYFFVNNNHVVDDKLKQNARFEKDGRIFIDNQLIFFKERKRENLQKPIPIKGAKKATIQWNSLMRRKLFFADSKKELDDIQKIQVKILNDGRIFLGDKEVNIPTPEPPKKRMRQAY